jgi:hypothetical protein
MAGRRSCSSAISSAARQAAASTSVAPHLSGPQGGYGGLATQYAKLEEAVALCDDAGLSPEPALRATSWGLGQVMGFNASLAGFASATEMVKAMQDSEDAQIMAMAGSCARRICTRPCCEGIGPPSPAATTARATRRTGTTSNWSSRMRGSRQARCRICSCGRPRLRCCILGFAPGKIDGVIGQRTRNAISSFRLQAGLPAGVELDGQCYLALCQRAGFRTVIIAL